MDISDFYHKHTGETCLIVGVGNNLSLTPPEKFYYPSFGVNTIFRYKGWKPTYFVGVDERLMVENGQEIARVYEDVPKFVPSPDFDALRGKNFYRFKHYAGDPSVVVPKLPDNKNALTSYGLAYWRVMDAVFQIAWFMGFRTMLLVGVQHKPDDGTGADRMHFWGLDNGAVPNQPMTWWFEGYKMFSRLGTIRVLNISEDTYVPEDVLPRDDWRKWAVQA